MIREATPEDIPRLVAMGERFLADTVYRTRGVAGDPDAMTRTVELLLAHDHGAVFVATYNGTVVGMIGLLVFEHPITGAATASELFWWMEPEYRGRGGSGVKLLKRAERWARDAGARTVHMIAPTPEIETLYRRLGYGYLEATYQRTFV